jgi:hypothetical protein
MDISPYFLGEDSINNTVDVPLSLPLHINGIQNLSDCSYSCALDLSDLSEIDMNTLTNDAWMGYNAPSLKTVDQEILTTPQLTPGSCISTTQPALDEFEVTLDRSFHTNPSPLLI